MNEDLATENQRIADNIRQYGWHCLHVFPTEEGQEKFSYTIGLTETFGAPEILIFGFEREKSHALLNECAQLLKNGHIITPDVEDSSVLAGDYKVVFRPVRRESFGEYLGTAMRYYRDRAFGAVVMFIPDREHRFPWQPGYDGVPAEEPLAIV